MKNEPKQCNNPVCYCSGACKVQFKDYEALKKAMEYAEERMKALEKYLHEERTDTK